MGSNLVAPESRTHSFLLRLWREASAAEAGRDIWRGHITHVASGASRYFTDLDQVVVFITPYVDGRHNRGGWRERVGQWLKPRKPQPTPLAEFRRDD